MTARIYTRTGDTGETGLFGGDRVLKDDVRVEAYGAVDELNASIGVVRACGPDPEIDTLLYRIQNQLLIVGSDLASPTVDSAGSKVIKRANAAMSEKLEVEIDKFEAELAPLTQFILPGGNATAAALHVSRTVCRRAERRCVTLCRSYELGFTDNREVVIYLNRLADLLFVLARAANFRSDVPDVIWNPEV